MQDTLADKCRQLAGRQRKILREDSLGNDDSRKRKFGLVQVVMSLRFTSIKTPLQAVDRKVSLITDTLKWTFSKCQAAVLAPSLLAKTYHNIGGKIIKFVGIV